MKRDMPSSKLRKWHRRAETVARRAGELLDDLSSEAGLGHDPLLLRFAHDAHEATLLLARRINARRAKRK